MTWRIFSLKYEAFLQVQSEVWTKPQASQTFKTKQNKHTNLLFHDEYI